MSDEIPLDLDGDGSFLDDYNYPEDPDDEPQYADGNEREHIYYLATCEHLNNEPYNSVGGLAEMEALKNGVQRVLAGEEEAVEYGASR